jgi:hypothetical protein
MSSTADSLPLTLLISLFCLLAAVSQAQPDGQGPRPFPQGPPPPHHGGHHGPARLPFLRNVSRAEAREFFQLASSENLTKSAIKSGLRSWAQSAGVAVSETATLIISEQQKDVSYNLNPFSECLRKFHCSTAAESRAVPRQRERQLGRPGAATLQPTLGEHKHQTKHINLYK